MTPVQRWELKVEAKAASGPFSVVCPDGEVYRIDAIDRGPWGVPDRAATLRRDAMNVLLAYAYLAPLIVLSAAAIVIYGRLTSRY